MRKRSGHRGESGQALVEAALTMPMAIFLILGTVQLFLMLQARIMAEYAVVQAVRQGSVRHGACEPMVHTAVSILLPTFRRTNDAASLVAAFKDVYSGNGNKKGAAVGGQFKFNPDNDFGHNGDIVWMYRREVTGARAGEERIFDNLSDPGSHPVLRAEMLYWFPMKIPFANWVIARMALAENGIRNYTAANPLIFTQKKANWNDGGGDHAVTLGEQRTEWHKRVDSSQYTVPIIVNAAMPMMSPPRGDEFVDQNCFTP